VAVVVVDDDGVENEKLGFAAVETPPAAAVVVAAGVDNENDGTA
jgi:hypothetical protein